MASELHPWRFEMDTFPSRLPCGHPYRHVFEPKLIAQQCAMCEAFFSKCFEQSTSWWFGSHFFLATVPSIHCHLPLSFSGFNLKAWKENSFVNFSLQPTAAHSLGVLLNLPYYFRFSLVQVVIEPCGSVVLSWRHGGHVTKPGIFSCRRRSCSKRRVCFHSNQYFNVPQENVNVSKEQCVC